MAKKNNKYTADKIGSPAEEIVHTDIRNHFYFGKENYKWMLVGLALIILGFVLMMGSDANTVDGRYDPDSWNEGIFSFRRIRLAPLLVIAGFVVEVFAILKRNR